PQMDIFSQWPSESEEKEDEAATYADEQAAAVPNPLLAALAEIQPDELSPREALEALYRLKGLEKE
ncbi:MAG TPA: hypothetical protein PL031_08300, partial [Neisseria sp.]|nr:hypothetical protein [Neisseria sp.]